MDHELLAMSLTEFLGYFSEDSVCLNTVLHLKVVWCIIFIFSGYLNDHRKLYENHLHVWRGVSPHHMKPCERGI